MTDVCRGATSFSRGRVRISEKGVNLADDNSIHFKIWRMKIVAEATIAITFIIYVEGGAQATI